MTIMEGIPKKYQKIFIDFNNEYDFAYLDSVVLAIAWRTQNKIVLPKNKPYMILGNTKESVFYKYIATLVENFYEKYERPEDRSRDKLELGHKLAIWIMKQPLDFKAPLIQHAEMNCL